MTQSEKNSISIYAWIMLIVLSIIWGSSFILIKKSLLALSPYEVGAMRVLIAGITLMPVLFIYNSQIKWSRWSSFLLVGLIGSGIPFILFPLAETRISSSLAGVLNSLTPLFALLFGVFWFGNKTNKRQLIGVLLGFFGALVLVLFGSRENEQSQFLYASLILLASILYGLNANLVKFLFQNTKAIILTAYSFALMIPFCIIYLLSENTFTTFINHPDFELSLISVLILGVIGTSLSTVIFFDLLQRTNAVFGASVAYLIPVVAIVFGVLDGEYFGLYHIIGTILILVAVKIISRKPN